MSEEKIISKIVFDMTQNKNPYFRIWTSDMDDFSPSIDIYSNFEYLLFTKRPGDKLTFEKNGKWFSVVENKDDKRSVSKAVATVRQSLIHIKDDSRITVSIEECDRMLGEFLLEDLEIVDKIVGNIEKSKSSFAKDIINNLKTKRADQTLNPIDTIFKIADRFKYGFNKSYVIQKEESV